MKTIIPYLSTDLLLFIGFLTLNLIIGLAVGRKVNTVRDFAIGKKDFSTATVTSTIVATWVSGSLMFTTLSQTYSTGLHFVIAVMGGSLGLLIIGQILAVRMGEFMNNMSIAEAMGDLYGAPVRLVTAISGILMGIGLLAIQFQIISKVITLFTNIEGVPVTIAAAVIVIIYSAFGGIRSVTITDVLQFIVFSIFIPILILVVWNGIREPKAVVHTLTNNPLFNLKKIVGWNYQFMSTIGLMLYLAIPAINPPSFQRIAMAKDTLQVKKAFTYTAGLTLLICLFMAFLGILLLSHNPNIEPSKLVNYMIDHYSYKGLRGLIGIGIVAMAMSTADSYLNASAVLGINDFMKAIRPGWGATVWKIRLFSIFLGICGLWLALSTNDILKLTLMAGSMYMPVVTVPMLLAIFGFRTNQRCVLIGMGAGIVTVICWNKFLSHIGMNNIPPAMVANLLFLMGSHYLLRQPGGWIGIKDKTPLLAARQKRKEWWYDLIQNFKKLSLRKYLERNLPTHEAIYPFIGLYIMGATYALFFTIPEAMVIRYQNLYDIAAHSVLVCIAGLLTYPAWPPTFRAKWFITYAWPLVIGYTLFVVGTQLVLMSEFNGVQVMILFSNLVVAGIFLSPVLIFALSSLGIFVGYLIFILNYDTIPYDGVFSSLKFNFIYVLLILSTFFLLIFRAKKQRDKVEAEKGYLGIAYAGKKKELTQVIQFSQQIAQEIEETSEMFNENALAYIRQLIYHIKDYVQLEVSTIALKNLIHDVKALLKIHSFEKEPSILIQMETKQKDISVDSDKIKQLLLNAIVAIHETNKANKPIRIILEDATLGYTVSYIKDYLKKIKALRITITTADTLPLANDIYTFNPMSFDSKTINEALVENLRTIDAHYGYAVVDRLDTQEYVIPIQVRDVRAKVMELLREPAKADPEELTHPVAIEIEEELWQELSHINIDRKVVEKALVTIKRYHAGVRRKSGEPFFTHPIQVALILLSYCQDQDAVIAALLHDTVEDTQLSIANIKALFGKKVAFLVEKVTNLDNQLRRLALGDHENVERLSDSGDNRVMYVKLADRMHNMRTISGHKSLDKRKHISQETLSFFVPAAFSLGLTNIAEELKKLSLDVLSKVDTGQ